MTPFTFASGNSFLCSCSRSSALAGELPRWSQHLASASLPTTNISSSPFKSLASNARARHCSRCDLRFCHAISNSLRRSWRFSSQCSTWETAKGRGEISEFWIRHIKITILEVLLFHSASIQHLMPNFNTKTRISRNRSWIKHTVLVYWATVSIQPENNNSI